jgi:hypothetical protein
MPADPIHPDQLDGEQRFRADLAAYLDSLPVNELAELLGEPPSHRQRPLGLGVLMIALNERLPDAHKLLPPTGQPGPGEGRRRSLPQVVADRRAARISRHSDAPASGLAEWPGRAPAAGTPSCRYRSRQRWSPRPDRSGWPSSGGATEERIAAHVAALGFADVGAYLVDRVVERGWLLAEVAVELGVHRVTVRRLLERHGIRRVRRTAMERAASESGRRVQAVSWQARRAARLAELGSADLAGYLKVRYVEQGMVGKADAGRAWGRPQVAGGGSWPGWGCAPDLKVRR